MSWMHSDMKRSRDETNRINAKLDKARNAEGAYGVQRIGAGSGSGPVSPDFVECKHCGCSIHAPSACSEPTGHEPY
jgi:hypothetical protein